MFLRTDNFLDCHDNFSKYISSTNSFLSGKNTESKWAILHLYMFIQSLLIIILSHNNSFSIIKIKFDKKKNDKKYTFKYDLSLNDLFKIELDKKTISLSPHFGSEEDFEKLYKSIDKLSIPISQNELVESYDQMNKLISIKELFKRVTKLINLDDQMVDSFHHLVEIRNNFIHFPPKSWSIEIAMINEMIIQCSKLSIFLLESNYVREYEIKKEEMISELSGIINSFGQSA